MACDIVRNSCLGKEFWYCRDCKHESISGTVCQKAADALNVSMTDPKLLTPEKAVPTLRAFTAAVDAIHDFTVKHGSRPTTLTVSSKGPLANFRTINGVIVVLHDSTPKDWMFLA